METSLSLVDIFGGQKKRIKCDSETRETYFSITFAFGTNMALTMPPTNIIKSQPMMKMVVCFLGRIWIMYKNRCWKKHLRWKKTNKSRQVVPKLKNRPFHQQFWHTIFEYQESLPPRSCTAQKASKALLQSNQCSG